MENEDNIIPKYTIKEKREAVRVLSCFPQVEAEDEQEVSIQKAIKIAFHFLYEDFRKDCLKDIKEMYDEMYGPSRGSIPIQSLTRMIIRQKKRKKPSREDRILKRQRHSNE